MRTVTRISFKIHQDAESTRKAAERKKRGDERKIRIFLFLANNFYFIFLSDSKKVLLAISVVLLLKRVLSENKFSLFYLVARALFKSFFSQHQSSHSTQVLVIVNREIVEIKNDNITAQTETE